MNETYHLNPAEQASIEALNQVYNCIDNRKSFVLEAGAGAGKTYSLIHALRHLIKTQGNSLLRWNQQIACITYTNVAKDEIKSRTDCHPVILAETIHGFCWSLLKDFQPKLRTFLPSIGKWAEKINEAGGIGTKLIKYELGYPKIEESEVLLGHDDILPLMVKMMEESKFRSILANRHPILFIDEYQDTDKYFVESLKQHFLNSTEGPLIGFFGDHWQKIYGSVSCGKVQHENLELIGKRANFRSEKRIVEFLNRMRVELPQAVCDQNSSGTIHVFHTNNWQGERLVGGHWGGDLPPDEAHLYLDKVIAKLSEQEWVFTTDKTKILMLTHNILAVEQGYPNLAKVFKRNDSYIKKEDDYISFFADTLEPVCDAYNDRRYGDMFTILDSRAKIRNHSDKIRWAEEMGTLQTLRQTGTIGQVIEHLKSTSLLRLPERIERKESRLIHIIEIPVEELTISDKNFLERIQNLKNVSYVEVIALTKFIQNQTPFATKHGVKGAEFENVLVVLGRGWNHYNFSDMLEWVESGIPSGKQDTFERNRNLFYVACSRPQKRLALLFTQKLSASALQTLNKWFGVESIESL